MGSVIFSLELTAEGKIFYESDITVNYPSLHITNFVFTTTWEPLSEILNLTLMQGKRLFCGTQLRLERMNG